MIPVVDEAVLQERLRTARLFAVYRFLAVTVFFGFTEFLGAWLQLPGWNPNWHIFSAYWIAAGAVWLGGRRSDAIARLGGLAIPLIDMPAVTILNWKALSAANSGFVYGSGTALLILLTIGSTAALDRTEVLLAGGMAIVLQTLLGLAIGPIVATILFANLMVVFAVMGCTYLIRRITELVREATIEQARRERLRRYFSPEVADRLSAALEEPRGESRTVTVLFSDLRDFTSFAERIPSDDVVTFLNAYHERMVATIFACGGTLDKFLGDGMMVYFGAPVAQEDHAARAVRCALAMQAELARWNAERSERGDVALAMGIGIHTGSVVVGAVGPPARREYTVVGDTVNVASRIQEMTREKAAAILISGATCRSAGSEIRTELVGLEPLRGRAQPMEIYRILGEGASSAA